MADIADLPAAGRPRRQIGLVGTRASWERFIAPVSLARLERVGDVRWLEYPGPDRTVGPPPDDPESIARLTKFVGPLDILIVSHGSPRITADVIAAAPQLKMIGDTHGDRFAQRVDVAAAAASGIVVVDTTNGSSEPVAEWALALALIGLRNAGAHFRRLIAGELLWPDRDVFRQDPGYLNGELTGKTVGIIAAGIVGRRLIELLRPFRTNVLVSDPAADAPLAAALGVDLVELPTLMARSDVVFCLVPLTSATRGLIGRDALQAMRPGTVFINVSRGQVVDSAALVERLVRGEIIGCLDVFDPEPIPVDSVLRRLPNVFISPHVAGVTAAAEPRFFDLMVDEVERVVDGIRPHFPLRPREP